MFVHRAIDKWRLCHQQWVTQAFGDLPGMTVLTPTFSDFILGAPS